MNQAFDEIISADAETRAGLFNTTAQRIGTTAQNVEKDFWVCWTLDSLFNSNGDSPRLLFKGGTSLSKGFGLIRRFSEDIDVTVFRDDLGLACSLDELEGMSRKKREAMLDTIEDTCVAYIQGPMLDRLALIVAETAKRTGVDPERLKIVVAGGDARQTLLLHYPTATPSDDYVEKVVRIESGAKSAFDPHAEHVVRPYVDDDVPAFDLAVPNVTIVEAERTFWDKVIILHGLRNWYERRGELKGGGHRVSRHYYDIHELMQADVGARALADLSLGENCVAHARTFFNRPDYDLASAAKPTFALTPEGGMFDALKADYVAMGSMIFGTPPSFEVVFQAVADLEVRLNASSEAA